MSKVKKDEQGRLILPDAFLRHWQISSNRREEVDIFLLIIGE